MRVPQLAQRFEMGHAAGSAAARRALDLSQPVLISLSPTTTTIFLERNAALADPASAQTPRTRPRPACHN